MAGFFTRLRELLFQGGLREPERVEPAPPAVPEQEADDAAYAPVTPDPAPEPEPVADPAPEPEADPARMAVDEAMEAPGIIPAEVPDLNDPVTMDDDPESMVNASPDSLDTAQDDGLVDLDMVESDFFDLDITPEPDMEDGEEALPSGPPAPLAVPALIAAWRGAVDDPDRRWAVFAHGTAVMLEGDQDAQAAADQLATHGLVTDEPGSAARRVVPLADGLGWVVASRHPAIMTYVAPDECPDGAEDKVGDLALLKRDADARAAMPVHVEGT